jgi:serine/threonine protein kinase
MQTLLTLHDSGAFAAQSERRLLERAVAGRYRVVDLVSRGGMGAVWKGWEPGLERSVAIKLLAPARVKDADERGRFRREGRILASLSHRNIVTILGTGETGDACWYAMPYLAGGTLARRLEEEPRLPAETVRSILTSLADALAYADGHGVVHRDLKAENILLDEGGKPVISDFGIAILRTSDHSRAEITKGYGTAAYMAPEQFHGVIECDGRLDLYALGVLGFRMLTGRFPFEGNPEQIAAAHVTRDVPQVAAHAAGVPPDLAAAIDRCLERRPADRWPDGSALRDALRAGTARPAGRVARLVRRLIGRPRRRSASQR